MISTNLPMVNYPPTKKFEGETPPLSSIEAICGIYSQGISTAQQSSSKTSNDTREAIFI